MSEVRAIVFDKSTKTVQQGGRDLAESYSSEPNSWIWVDISGSPDSRETDLLRGSFNISKLAIQDAHRDRHPPKLEIFDDFVFIMLRDLITAYEDEDPEIAELAIFASDNFVITRHHVTVPSVDRVFDSAVDKPSILNAGPGRLLYMVIRRIVDSYTPEVLALEEHLGNLEDLVFESGKDEIVERLSRYNRALKRMRRHLVYQCNVIAQISGPADKLPLTHNQHEFNDLFENLERLASLCQLNQELAVDLLNTHLSLLSHKLNQVMRVLTIATVIFLPLGLLAGIYGMNFELMPELGWKYGYFAVLGAMATVVISLVTVFKKRGWL